MNDSKLPIFVMSVAFIVAPTMALAWQYDDHDEAPFAEARLFFELNDTDGDLGIHGKVDGDAWKYLEIEDPHDRKMANIWIRGRLRRQGMTELFFESAEPCFPSNEDCEDPLEPEVFFNRFPEGEYDIEGFTLDWEERESEVYLSHVIPAAPDAVAVGGFPSASLATCEGEGDEPIPVVDPETLEDEEVPFEWEAVTQSHAARWASDPAKIGLGTDGFIEVAYYEVVVEIDETPFKSTSIIPGDQTEWDMSDDFFDLAEGENSAGEDCSVTDKINGECFAQYKYELLVRTNVYNAAGEAVIVEEDGEEVPLVGNKSALESCFLVPVRVDD